MQISVIFPDDIATTASNLIERQDMAPTSAAITRYIRTLRHVIQDDASRRLGFQVRVARLDAKEATGAKRNLRAFYDLAEQMWNDWLYVALELF